MSDTLDFLDAQGSTATDIDLEMVATNLDSLSAAEMIQIGAELGLGIGMPMTTEDMRNKIQSHISANDGTANVTDITHEKESVMTTGNRDFMQPTQNTGRTFETTTAGASTPLVEGSTETDDNGNMAIQMSTTRYWLNPYTNNRVANGSRDVDGRANINGFAIHAPLPNPTNENDNIYDD